MREEEEEEEETRRIRKREVGRLNILGYLLNLSSHSVLKLIFPHYFRTSQLCEGSGAQRTGAENTSVCTDCTPNFDTAQDYLNQLGYDVMEMVRTCFLHGCSFFIKKEKKRKTFFFFIVVVFPSLFLFFSFLFFLSPSYKLFNILFC